MSGHARNYHLRIYPPQRTPLEKWARRTQRRLDRAFTPLAELARRYADILGAREEGQG